MSLYTLSTSAKLPLLPTPSGISINQTNDAVLLSALGNTSLDDVRMRLANDNIAFIAYINSQPAAFGWMARSSARIGELNHEFILPEGNRYLWNFRTVEAFRGLGIYPYLLQFIIQSEAAFAERYWIIHAPENKSSLRGIKKAGFQYLGRLYTKADGTTSIESRDSAKALSTILKVMNFSISEETPASCWNCSSSYLKKRMPFCCCAAAETACTGINLLSMAS